MGVVVVGLAAYPWLRPGLILMLHDMASLLGWMLASCAVAVGIGGWIAVLVSRRSGSVGSMGSTSSVSTAHDPWVTWVLPLIRQQWGETVASQVQAGLTWLEWIPNPTT